MDLICKDLFWKLKKYLTKHECSVIVDLPCPECKNYINFLSLDSDIQTTKECTKVKLKSVKGEHTTQRIHVIGNHWPLINTLKHRKFKFVSYNMVKPTFKEDAICITDVGSHGIISYPNKFIITQENSIRHLNLYLENLDYLIIEKIYMNKLPTNDKQFPEYTPDFDIPDKGYLVIDFKDTDNFKKYYSLGI